MPEMSFDHRKWLDRQKTRGMANQEAIRVNPDNVKAYFGLGWALYQLSKYRDAEEPLRRAAALEPDDYYTHYHLGLVLGELNRLTDSEFELLHATQIRPDYADAHYGLAITYTKQKRFADAIAACLEAIRLKPDYADAHFGLGYAYYKLYKHNKAIAAYTEALSINPNHVPTAANLDGCILIWASFRKPLRFWHTQSRLRRSGEAETPEPKPDFPRLYLKLGAALAKAGNTEARPRGGAGRPGVRRRRG
jgi:tetratricopeptide (TPR) repeat protein